MNSMIVVVVAVGCADADLCWNSWWTSSMLVAGCGWAKMARSHSWPMDSKFFFYFVWKGRLVWCHVWNVVCHLHENAPFYVVGFSLAKLFKLELGQVEYLILWYVVDDGTDVVVRVWRQGNDTSRAGEMLRSVERVLWLPCDDDATHAPHGAVAWLFIGL